MRLKLDNKLLVEIAKLENTHKKEETQRWLNRKLPLHHAQVQHLDLASLSLSLARESTRRLSHVGMSL